MSHINCFYPVYCVLKFINLLCWITHFIWMFLIVSIWRFELNRSLYREKLCSTSTETNGAYLVSICKGSSVKVAKVSTSGLLFKFVFRKSIKAVSITHQLLPLFLLLYIFFFQTLNHIRQVLVTRHWVGLGGLGVTCSPRDIRFAGSNPAEVGWIFSGRKNPKHKS